MVVTSRSAEHVDETCREVERACGRPCIGLQLDLTDTDAVARVVADVTDRFGRIDILSNNAGLGSPHTPSLVETTDEEWDELFRVNVTGMFSSCRAARPHMQRGAAIVNMASINAFVGADNHAAYVATKGAVMQLSRALAVELAPAGIRVNAVCPGVIDSPLTDRYVLASDDPDAASARLCCRVTDATSRDRSGGCELRPLPRLGRIILRDRLRPRGRRRDDGPVTRTAANVTGSSGARFPAYLTTPFGREKIEKSSSCNAVMIGVIGASAARQASSASDSRPRRESGPDASRRIPTGPACGGRQVLEKE